MQPPELPNRAEYSLFHPELPRHPRFARRRARCVRRGPEPQHEPHVDPLISLDLDIVVAVEQLEQTETLLHEAGLTLKRFPHHLNIAVTGSDVRVQIQTDPRYYDFVEHAAIQEVLGLSLPVASIEDVLQGKIWAYLDPERRRTKQLKDLTDIARLLESYPHLRARVPNEILARFEANLESL